MAQEIATLAGGCFWCTEAVYQNLKGVSAVESGYIGGERPNPTYEPPPVRKAADGGIMALEMGGTTYPRKQGHIKGPGTGTSDSIPALLSDGEFVFTAKAVRAMGQGSRRKGAKKMYKLMKMLEGKAA